MMKLEIPRFDEVVERNTSGMQFGSFQTADNVKWAVRDHHARWVWSERGEMQGRYDYTVKFVNKNGQWVNRTDDTVYRVMPDGSLELVS